MDLMNSIARAVLTAYTYDTTPDLLDIETNLRQAVELIAGFPTIAAYAYQAKAHYHLGRALMMRYPDPTHGTAENILTLIRESGSYTQLEAETLDLALILHAEHGGGNNSSFVTHVTLSRPRSRTCTPRSPPPRSPSRGAATAARTSARCARWPR